MAEWKCTECGRSKESRCKPRKCPACESSKGFEKKGEPVKGG